MLRYYTLADEPDLVFFQDEALVREAWQAADERGGAIPRTQPMFWFKEASPPEYELFDEATMLDVPRWVCSPMCHDNNVGICEVCWLKYGRSRCGHTNDWMTRPKFI